MENKKRLLGWLLVVAGLGIAVRTGLNIFRLWKLGERVKDAQKEVTIAENLNQELQKRLAYVKTPDFVEKEARDKLGYGRKGETIVVVPENNDQTANSNNQKQPDEANWKRWWKLYIGI